jgi:hypothetical protein
VEKMLCCPSESSVYLLEPRRYRQKPVLSWVNRSFRVIVHSGIAAIG